MPTLASVAQFLQAGIGYGGSCFPKDTRALQVLANNSGYDFRLLSAIIDVNNRQKHVAVISYVGFGALSMVNA